MLTAFSRLQASNIARKAPKRLLIVPGARHGLSYCVEKEAYERATKEFWREFDNYASQATGQPDIS